MTPLPFFGDETDTQFRLFIIKSIIDYFKTKTELKYRRYEKERLPNEIFVHEILSWLFKYGKIDDDNPPPKVIIGDIIDDFMKSALRSDSPVLSVPYEYGGAEFIITGKPDAIIQFRDRVYIIECKYSDTLHEYHILQTYLYGYLYYLKNDKTIPKGCVVLLKSNLQIHIFDINLDTAKTIIEQYIKNTVMACCRDT